MVLTAYSVLSPVTGLCCHRHRRSLLRQFDASVGASGPHGFAVRISAARPRKVFALRRCRVHRIPHPTSVTIAIRPSCGTGWRINKSVSTNRRNEIFLREGLDTWLAHRAFDLPDGQITLVAKSPSPSLRTQGPISTGVGGWAKSSNSESKNRPHGVWVPAFAGATRREVYSAP
jgi:hypothetical protein